MSHQHPSAGPDHPLDTAPPVGLPGAIAQGSEEVGAALGGGVDDRPKLRAGEMVPIFLAQLTLFMALVVPSAFSLAIKIGAMDPANKDSVLALTIGIAGTLVLFTNPLIGVLSDRTRSRFGRRRPFFVLGVLLGTVGSIILSVASSAPVLIVGWCIGLAGYSMGNQIVITYLGDRLPESQRGKVMGINGALTQVGPILGIVLAGAFASQFTLMFLVPAAIALLGTLWFAAVMKDPKFEGDLPTFRPRSLLRGFYFNPVKHSNFGWVILSKTLVFVYIAFTGLYAVYVLMSRFSLDAAGAASFIGAISLGGIVLAIVGALGGGILSDKLRSRKPFLIIAALVLASSAVMVGTASSMPQFVIGSLLASFGIGVYGSVDQALALDTLPSEENENGRYLSVFGLANAVPQAVGPLLAGVVLSLAGGDYMWVYLIAAAAAVLGALTIIPIRLERRPKPSTADTADTVNTVAHP